MRVALVVDQLQASGGGVERVAWQVAHGLAAAGDEVHVVARKVASDTTHLDLPFRVHLVPVGPDWQPRRVRAFSRGAGAVLESLGDDLLIHGFARTHAQHIYRAGGGSHRAAMLHTYGRRGAAWRRLSPRHRVLLSIEAAILGDPTRLIQCVSHRVRDEIRDDYGVADERLVVIHNAVDAEQFDRDRHADAAAALRARTETSPRRVWLLAGSGGRRKGLDVAIAALARCRDRDSVLWVAGRDTPAPWQRLADRLGVGERVHFLGSRHDMPAVYAAADALIHPARYDPFSNACLEAAASGLPVVTSATNGAAEVLADAAITLPTAEDATGFARAMERLADPVLRKQLGDRGRHLARGLDWRTHVAQLRKLYQRSLDAREEGAGDT